MKSVFFDKKDREETGLYIGFSFVNDLFVYQTILNE